MGEAKRRKRLDSSYGKVPEHLKVLSLRDFYIEMVKEFGLGCAVLTQSKKQLVHQTNILANFSLVSNPNLITSDRELIKSIDTSKTLAYVSFLRSDGLSALALVPIADVDGDQLIVTFQDKSKCIL